MQQPLINNDSLLENISPNLQKTLIVQFYQNHQSYKQLARKFHKMVLYIFCCIQIIWIILSYNITTVNDYNYFIVEFQSNFNDEYKAIYLKNHPKYASILEHVNSFANDYTIICWLIWLSHIGFQVIFAYIVYANRIFFKEYSTGVKQMLPIFFTLLTTFVIRDCLLMSVSQVVHFDLSQIQQLIQSQQQEFSTYGPNFLSFIAISMNLAETLSVDFQELEIVTYVQQICDGAIICSLTIQIFRIYSSATKCQQNLDSMIQKKQFAIDQLTTTPPPSSHRKFSEFGSKISQESQYSISHHASFFNNQKNIIKSQKQINGGYSHKQPIGYSTKQISYNGDGHGHHCFKKQISSHPQGIKMMKKSQSSNHIRKLQKSGSCNYLKGSQQISQQNVIQATPKTPKLKQQQHSASKLKMKKQISMDNDIEKKIINRSQRKDSFYDKLVRGQHVMFQV